MLFGPGVTEVTKAKPRKGEEKFICHARNPAPPAATRIANMRPWHIILQQMTNLDDIDHRILRELSRDARQPNLRWPNAWACRPRPACAACRRWSGRGSSSGYRAVLDPEKLGIGFVAYVTVGLNAHTKAAQEALNAPSPAPPRCGNVTTSPAP